MAPHHLNKFLHPSTIGAHPISLCLWTRPWWFLPYASLLITFTSASDGHTFYGLHSGVFSALSSTTHCCPSRAQTTVCPSLTHSWYVTRIHLGPQHTWFLPPHFWNSLSSHLLFKQQFTQPLKSPRNQRLPCNLSLFLKLDVLKELWTKFHWRKVRRARPFHQPIRLGLLHRKAPSMDALHQSSQTFHDRRPV